jgi:spore coat polysaccharide biosynthesis predicted glycosyltransferase SpsG/RimJ/RimL family protein N-acetyltransferase
MSAPPPPPPPSLLLCADSGPSIGVGHISRCVAFAEEAVARGWRTVVAGSPRWLGARLDELGVGILRPARTADDLGDRLAETRADIVLVDDYRIAGDVAGAARRHGALLVSMEDAGFGRRGADVVVDCGLARTPAPDDAARVVLRGPAYAPLRSVVRAARAQRSGAAPPGRPPRVVVVMGGADWPDVVGALLTALRDTGQPVDALALCPSPVPIPDAQPGQHIAVTGPTADLPMLLTGADLVVSASGVTLLELCCLGLPMALVQLTDNQELGYREAVGRGLAAGLGSAAQFLADPVPATRTLRSLLTDPDARAGLAAAAFAEVDGAGAGRILDIARSVATLAARAATAADAELLLYWRNDPGTRAWSRTRAPVEPAEHLTWLNSVLASDDHLLLVIDSDDEALGTVRFDRIDTGIWEVGITVGPQQRGRRLAGAILAAGEAELARRTDPETVLACVHRDNHRSAALFRRSGYSERPGPADGPYRWLAKRLDPA